MNTDPATIAASAMLKPGLDVFSVSSTSSLLRAAAAGRAAAAAGRAAAARTARGLRSYVGGGGGDRLWCVSERVGMNETMRQVDYYINF
jgi:hypothetical protein